MLHHIKCSSITVAYYRALNISYLGQAASEADLFWSRSLPQEDAEALRRHTGQTRPGAHLVRAHHREGRRRASLRPRGGTEITLWLTNDTIN